MRIIIANTYHFRRGGDSVYALSLGDLLRSRGHEVAFFAMQSKENLPDPNADLFVSHIDFKALNHHKTMANGVRALVRAIYSREAREKFAELLIRFSPDLIHLQNIHAHITPSVVFEAKSRRLPVLWTLHDFKLVCPNSRFLIDASGEICEACIHGGYYRAILRRCKKGSLTASMLACFEAYVHRAMGLLRQIDAFLTPSLFLRAKLATGGLPLAKLHHLPNFLPAEMFNRAAAWGENPYFLFLGQLCRVKGIPILLEACRQAPEVKLLLAGHCEPGFAPHTQADWPSNATYLGPKQGEELLRLLRNCLAVVLPSVWYENQPLCIAEAFANGKPAIASALGGMSELVEHGERGYLFPAGDVAALARAMLGLWKDRSGAERMGESARLYACNQFSPDAHYGRLIALYTGATSRVE